MHCGVSCCSEAVAGLQHHKHCLGPSPAAAKQRLWPVGAHEQGNVWMPQRGCMSHLHSRAPGVISRHVGSGWGLSPRPSHMAWVSSHMASVPELAVFWLTIARDVERSRASSESNQVMQQASRAAGVRWQCLSETESGHPEPQSLRPHLRPWLARTSSSMTDITFSPATRKGSSASTLAATSVSCPRPQSDSCLI